MTGASERGMEEHHESSAFVFLEKLLFEVLLRTDGRTTDILEALTDDKMSVRVIAQERIVEGAVGHGEIAEAPYYRRESILIGEKSGIVISHNIALVNSKYVPAPMFEALAAGREGIGKTIVRFGLPTSRKVADYGWISGSAAVDLFHKPFKPYFLLANEKTPFKNYCIYFDSAPGIHMIEYFNPRMIRHRLNKFLSDIRE